MVFRNDAIRQLWRHSRPRQWPGEYWMVSFELDRWDRAGALLAGVQPGSDYASAIRDGHEIAAILPAAVWDRARAEGGHRAEYGPLACITLDVPLEIEVAGYLAPVVAVLAEAGISIVPQCALVYDHILIHQRDTARAIALIENLCDLASAD
jgi:hypothetical protein